MIYSIQKSILSINDFISSLNQGIVFIIVVISVIFFLYMLHSFLIKKDWRYKTKFERLCFLPAMSITLLFIFLLIIAGDVSPNRSPEAVARIFAEGICNERSEDDLRNRNTFLSSKYYNKFQKVWKHKFDYFADIQCDAKHFILIEYHYVYKEAAELEKCKVILETLNIIFDKIESVSLDNEKIKDIQFEIHLIKETLDSRFLGKYARWRISNFSYTESEPYTFKEWEEKIKRKYLG